MKKIITIIAVLVVSFTNAQIAKYKASDFNLTSDVTKYEEKEFYFEDIIDLVIFCKDTSLVEFIPFLAQDIFLKEALETCFNLIRIVCPQYPICNRWLKSLLPTIHNCIWHNTCDDITHNDFGL